MTTPAVGEPAPDFTLNSTSGKPVTLSSFRGERPVLLAFFPLAFSSVCTAEFCELGSEWDDYVGTGVEVFPISVDSTYALKEFKAKHAMPFDLLSDFHRDVSRKYGVLIEEKGFSNRAYFLIDRDGVVRWAHVEEHPGKRRESREIREQIAQVV